MSFRAILARSLTLQLMFLIPAGSLDSVSEHVRPPENQEDSRDAAEKQSLTPQFLNEHEHGNRSYPEQVHHAGYKQERH